MKYRLFVEDENYLVLLNPMSLVEIKMFVVENELPSILFCPPTKEFIEEVLIKFYGGVDNSNISERFKPFFERYKHVLNIPSSAFVPFDSNDYDVRPHELFTYYVSDQEVPLIITPYDVFHYKDCLSLIEEYGVVVDLPISEFFVDSFSENNNNKSESKIPLVLKVLNEEAYSYIILDGYRVVGDLRDAGVEHMEIKLLEI